MVPASAARWALVLLEHKSERTYLLVMLLNAGYVVVSACNSQAMCLHEVQVDRFMSVTRVADAVTHIFWRQSSGAPSSRTSISVAF